MENHLAHTETRSLIHPEYKVVLSHCNISLYQMWLRQIKEFLFHKLSCLVLTVTWRLWAGRPTNRDSIPGVHTGSEAHPASYPMDNGKFPPPPPEVKAAGTWTYTRTTPSWRSAWADSFTYHEMTKSQMTAHRKWTTDGNNICITIIVISAVQQSRR